MTTTWSRREAAPLSVSGSLASSGLRWTRLGWWCRWWPPICFMTRCSKTAASQATTEACGGTRSARWCATWIWPPNWAHRSMSSGAVGKAPRSTSPKTSGPPL